MYKIILLNILCIIIAHAGMAQNSPTNGQHRIVMQLSSNDTLTWKGLMNNLRNLKEGWGEKLTIEVITHGPGIEMLMKHKTTQLLNIQNMKSLGILFYACENTMKEKKIAKDEIIAESEFVKMGIGQIIIRQEEGWSYIKAGF